MTSAEIRAFCERFAKAWERSDVAALSACYAEDCEVVSPIFHTLRGRAEVETSFRDLFQAFSDYSIRVNDMIIDSDGGGRAALVWMAQSTHRGPIFGMPASGRRIESQVAFIMTLKDGRIASERRIYDFTGRLIQMGVLKAKTA
ncbi:MAG: hypothetical protein A3H97_20330 [Acidobacteria bacterium RIFCSPLOWO2_02_FULL_65_29]|nr:MAG: hypothetical protein A3H97_20330 [Acidobacteria bacterium RIFCSPLOWO2_02_FULL_65_29]